MSLAPLRITDLHAYYGESHVLHGVTCQIDQGEVVTLLGRNGAGRTTTLRALLGLVSSRSGSVMINGQEAIALPSHRIAHLGVGYCPEERGIYASLSAEENLLLPPPLAPGGLSLEEISSSNNSRAPVRRMRASASICCSPPDRCVPWLARRSRRLGNMS